MHNTAFMIYYNDSHFLAMATIDDRGMFYRILCPQGERGGGKRKGGRELGKKAKGERVIQCASRFELQSYA